MNELLLRGCTTDSLLGYLKALGILRIIGTQLDREVRGLWRNESFVLRTVVDRSSLEQFFNERYAPTPVLNPWNKSAGFDGKAGDRPSALLDRVRGMHGERWKPIQSVLKTLDGLDVPAMRERMVKDDLIRYLRSALPDEGLPWLDAVVAVTNTKRSYSWLMGSGGNDGRLDFSVNFIERLLEITGDSKVADASALLRDALDGTADARALDGAAIGQFSLRHAGGANASSGFDAKSLVNPWEFVLVVEGAMLFSGGLVKRSSMEADPAFPFAFKSSPAGYASASRDEETRAEIWLPTWRGAASLGAVTKVFRDGRMDAPSDIGAKNAVSKLRTAGSGAEAAEAVLTRGADAGIEKFSRIVIAKRNGLAYGALYAGRVTAGADAVIRGISLGARRWVERVRWKGLEEPKVLDGLRSFDEALFAYARTRINDAPLRARALQDVIVALAAIDNACSRVREMRPLEFLPASLYQILDDDRSVEHRIARALAGLGGADLEFRLRFQIAPVRLDEKKRLVYDLKPHGSWIPVDARRSLGALYRQRVRMAGKGERSTLLSSSPASLDDAVAVLSGHVGGASWPHIARLVEAYAIVEPRSEPACRRSFDAEPIPAAFAVVRLALDHFVTLDERIIELLIARRGSEAVRLAAQRLRVLDDLPSNPREVGDTMIEDPIAFLAALAIPTTQEPPAYRALLEAALCSKVKGSESAQYLTHLNDAWKKQKGE